MHVGNNEGRIPAQGLGVITRKAKFDLAELLYTISKTYRTCD